MSLPSDNNFNDYTFGASISSNSSEDNDSMVSPTHSVSPSKRHSSFVGPLPLTRDRLEKKDKLDILLCNRPTPIIKRRRSICVGNIYRHSYNEDNSPMTLSTPFKKRTSDCSDASIKSPNSDYNKPTHYQKTSSANETELMDSSRGRTYGSFAQQQSIYSSEHEEEGPPRRFSDLVRLSAAHITMERTKKNKKRIYQSTLYTLFEKLTAMALRVVDARTSEPAETRMSVDEMTSLSRYLYVSKSGNYSDSSSSSSSRGNSSSNNSTSREGERNMVSPVIGLFVDEVTDEEENNNREDTEEINSDNNLFAANDRRVTTPILRISQRKRHLSSSLGNIFPFPPLERIATISRSGSEESSQQEEPTETDRLLPSPISRNSSHYYYYIQQKRKISSLFDTCHRFVKHHLVRPILRNHQQLHKNTQIRFEGWSLYLFAPTSLTRFYLWKLIGSSWFEIFILFLLFTQWILLSFIPIRFNTDQPFSWRTGDYLLFIINIIYTFEAISKIIIYGLLLTTHSTTRPTLTSWIKKNRNHQRRPRIYLALPHEEDAVSIEEEDTNSTYTRHQHHHHKVPAFASQSSSSTTSNGERYHHQNSGGSVISDSSSGDNCIPHGFSANSSSNYYNDNLHPRKYRTRINNDEEEGDETMSILTTAEQHVLASLTTPNVINNVLDAQQKKNEEYGDFLKVNHSSYLSSVANIVDIVSITSYWIDIVMVLYFNKRPWSLFQAMAAMRLLRFLVITEGTAVIMKSLHSSCDMLKNVMGFFMFFWLLFSLVGLFVFMNAFSRRCAVVEPQGQALVKNMLDINYVEPRIPCSGYMISETERTGVFDINTGQQYTRPGGDGLFCKLGQICIQDTANQPKYGHMSFENILYTMLNIFTVISTEDWTDLLYISQDSVSNLGAALFYSFCIYLMTFIMVPMFIAVITTSFSHVRGDMRESAFSIKKKERLLLAASTHHHQPMNKKHDDDDDEENEEWIYEGMGLGGANMFQKRLTFQVWAHHIINTLWFPYLGSVLVVINVISMMFYSAKLQPQDKGFLDSVGHAFTIIFAIEILIRIYGYWHWTQFWRRARNRADLIIVIATVIDEIPIVNNSQYHIYLLIFSVLRSYRISYLFPGVLQLISDVLGDGQGILNLTFFTFLVLFLLSPISVQLFGGDFNFVENDDPSMRFDNSYQAFLALFQIMTGENWTDILYDAMHSQEHSSVAYAALFMIFLYFAVHYMVLNLFIAVIMENFDLDEEEIKQIQIKKYIRKHKWKPEYFKMDSISRLLLPLFIIQDEQKLNFKSIPQNLVAHVTTCKFKEFLTESTANSPESDYIIPSSTDQNFAKFSLTGKGVRSTRLARRPSSALSFKSGHTRTNSNVSQYSNRSLRFDPLSSITYGLSAQDREPVVKYGDEYEFNVARENKAVIVENLNVFRSIALLKNDHAVRKFCTRVATMESYNWFIVTLICISTVLAMWTDEFNRSAHPKMIAVLIEPIQFILLLIYWIDIFIHMVADGMFMLPKSYMRNAWNLLDMINLIAQVVMTILSAVYQKSDRSADTYAGYLRILRTLRAIRIVYYVNGMRVIFLDLVYGLPKMIDAVALNILVFVPFAIYGCYLFSGRFSLCNDDSAISIKECYGEFKSTDDDNSDILLPRVWKNPYDYSYDTFVKSLLHLFENASGEGWILSLFSAMSVQAKSTDQANFSWSSTSIFHSLFYVAFMFVASLCSIQLFIGVFLEIFKQRSGISSLTNTQRQFQDLQRQLALIKPSRKAERPTDSSVRAGFYDLVIDKRGKFAHFMATVLTANIIVFATEHLHQPQWLTYLQNGLNCIFLCLYVFEMGAKIAGLGFYKWASSRWNIYDFVLVGLSIITSIPRIFIELPFGWDVARKLFLVGIAFRLAQRNESLDTLFISVKCALPSIFFVSTVFAIVIVCFGVIFQEHFSSTRYGPYGNEHANFRSLFNTILTLFRITTGENWDFLMHDFTVVSPKCVGKGDCGWPNYAIALFISFYIICTYIFVNLFTVTVIDNFSFTFDKRNQFTLITRTDLRHFKTAWSYIDPRATGYISVEDVPKFLRRLDGVLSIRIYEKEHSLPILLDASNHIDADPHHLISVPLSDRKMSAQFAANNMIGERLFNIHELNRNLSSIDPQIIRERRRQYTLVYQEIVNSASHRGVAFHDMLEILAIRLVDISKSLTFDELVNRARIQDKIEKKLAADRTKGLVDMLILRRKYLKERQKARNSQLRKGGNNLNVVGNWLTPSKLTTPTRERSNPFLQLRPSLGKSPKVSDRSIPKVKIKENDGNGGVPTIVVDQPWQSLDNSMLLSDNVLQIQQHNLRLPDQFATLNNGSMARRKSTPAIIPVTLGSPKARRLSELPSSNNVTSSKSRSLSVSPPRSLTRRASALSIRRMSLTASIMSSEDVVNDEASEILAIENTDDDIFTQYYAVDMAMDDMTSLDAEKIVNKIQHSTWSDLLNQSGYNSNEEEGEQE